MPKKENVDQTLTKCQDERPSVQEELKQQQTPLQEIKDPIEDQEEYQEKSYFLARDGQRRTTIKHL
ncbi:hypothetical protein PanWU01x14_130230 [Parasponia andersonii]|uniref:Uncharacterized protein n=1 Tax=Parasponia andersonii TaxID=3476 RepID=A0A2P5CR64_PARAD|nr:hypothetical protein PanWU01x14_130230 [Parasponia andersonii]